MAYTHIRRSTTRGNILFLILLAVVLFAALSYAVTQSTRGGGNDASAEKVRTGAAAILQIATQIDAALLRMQMTQGIKPENISFEYMRTNLDGSSYNFYINPACTSDACRLFHINGGGVAPIIFQQYANMNSWWGNQTWPIPGSMDFYLIQWPYAGTDANDVVLRITGLDPYVCNEIDRSLNLSPRPVLTTSSTSSYLPANWNSTAMTCTDNCHLLMDKTSLTTGTTTRGSSNFCSYFHLMIVR